MKAYIVHWASKSDVEQTRWDDLIAVHYGQTPRWEIDNEERAARELNLLKSMYPHVGDHYCELALEELENGRFTVVSSNHPEPQVN